MTVRYNDNNNENDDDGEDNDETISIYICIVAYKDQKYLQPHLRGKQTSIVKILFASSNILLCWWLW